jgi:hypothetical protein
MTAIPPSRMRDNRDPFSEELIREIESQPSAHRRNCHRKYSCRLDGPWLARNPHLEFHHSTVALYLNRRLRSQAIHDLNAVHSNRRLLHLIRIFTEPLSKVCAPYAQQTKRAGEIISAVGRALGGRPGQRLMRRLGVQVSAHTGDPASQKGGAPACVAPADPRPWRR